MISLIFCIALVQQPSILRVDYTVAWVEDTRKISATLHLNRRSDGNFVLVCRKTTAGVFFKYWATQRQNVLYFPRESIAFEGSSDIAFRLFPGGPRLVRKHWLTLLFEPEKLQDIPGVTIEKDGQWMCLWLRDYDFELRWRERKRTVKNAYSERLFEPRIRDETEWRNLIHLDELWKPR